MADEPFILLVDDNENDALLATRALKQALVTCSLIHLRDGEEAINYLAGNAPYHDRAAHSLPSVVLLDLKMPRYSGFEVLSWIQSQPQLAHMPVFVLTGSIYEEDRVKAKNLGAIGYQVKPVSFTDLIQIANNLKVRFTYRPSPAQL